MFRLRYEHLYVAILNLNKSQSIIITNNICVEYMQNYS